MFEEKLCCISQLPLFIMLSLQTFSAYFDCAVQLDFGEEEVYLDRGGESCFTEFLHCLQAQRARQRLTRISALVTIGET